MDYNLTKASAVFCAGRRRAVSHHRTGAAPHFGISTLFFLSLWKLSVQYVSKCSVPLEGLIV